MITKETVEHIANLARLAITEEETKSFAEYLNSVLSHMEQLNAVNTDGIEPTSFADTDVTPVREDVITPSLSNDEALQN